MNLVKWKVGLKFGKEKKTQWRKWQLTIFLYCYDLLHKPNYNANYNRNHLTQNRDKELKRYQEMFSQYKEYCKKGLYEVGKLPRLEGRTI